LIKSLPKTSHKLSQEEILADYKLAVISRECSYLVRREVFAGRAKFGIYGDGKELANIALAKAMKQGDYVCGYYRDQTIVVANGEITWLEYFAQLYGHPDVVFEPYTGGRSMNNHHATRWLDDNGLWKDQTLLYNSPAGVSSTAGQMPRALGLAYASKYFQKIGVKPHLTKFSKEGLEVVFTTIGDASTSEGMFLETVNAAGVLQIPLVMSVWDDGYGISVPSQYQTTKSSISKVLAGFQSNQDGVGLEIFEVKAWDYTALVETYQEAAQWARKHNRPCLVHVKEMTQLQGHSASGSHERYKSATRLQFEHDMDCNLVFKHYIIEQGLATPQQLEAIDADAHEQARNYQKQAWANYQNSIKPEYNGALELLRQAVLLFNNNTQLVSIRDELAKNLTPIHKDSVVALKEALRLLGTIEHPIVEAIKNWVKRSSTLNEDRYSSYLYSKSVFSPLLEKGNVLHIDSDHPAVDGREIIKAAFDALLEKYPEMFVLGEDVGKIGDVNQSLAGLQEKFGEHRVTDTGIRETTIVGQGIGAAMRGLRPIVEIQYLDYIYYALATLTDDLACLHYRTVGGQKAPLIVRTRGHRLEGIWHSGSPMAVLLNSLRGMHLCVPRNMTQAAGMYNTLMAGDDPALVIECLNGYRQKEAFPKDIANYKVGLGYPEILLTGNDLTIVTYGSMCRIVLTAAQILATQGISVEVVDVQTLLPFDRTNTIAQSIAKTHRVLFTDEDMPGGATAYMLQKVMEVEGVWQNLDSKPSCLTAKAHRPAYTTDGDYFSKPNAEEVFEVAYGIMHEANPTKFPKLY
jgi:pyruvate/2-oxoglutarate/acetoin dehydrogenase E1 component/TPP-dependent pyruvate/acetoin dehydrogenase alpha subunit